MAIRKPSIRLSNNDKRLVLLLERLLEESGTPGRNLEEGLVGLSEQEATEIAERIDLKLESREFWQTAALIEHLSHGNREQAREIYLQGRSERGASRIMSSTHYHEFLARLGFEKPYLPSVKKMDFEHFVRMERRAWEELRISPHLIDLLERFLRVHQKEIEAARTGTRPLTADDVSQQLKAIKSTLNRSSSTTWDLILQTDRIAGALTLFTNMGLMFSTRDWSVASTMSNLAGAVGLVAGK